MSPSRFFLAWYVWVWIINECEIYIIVISQWWIISERRKTKLFDGFPLALAISWMTIFKLFFHMGLYCDYTKSFWFCTHRYTKDLELIEAITLDTNKSYRGCIEVRSQINPYSMWQFQTPLSGWRKRICKSSLLTVQLCITKIVFGYIQALACSPTPLQLSTSRQNGYLY